MPNIILAVTGGIAAYKAADLASVLANEPDYAVNVIMTENAKKFITPLTLATLSKNPVFDDASEWSPDGIIKHIEIAKWCDLFVVVPATANTIYKMAHGVADNLLTSAYLAYNNRKTLICPAMNTRMWESKETQHNLNLLANGGKNDWHMAIKHPGFNCRILPPDEGRLACGDVGMGKLPSIRMIVETIKDMLKSEALEEEPSFMGLVPGNPPLKQGFKKSIPRTSNESFLAFSKAKAENRKES